MKIAIDSGPLKSGHKVRGIGVYTRELIEELEKLKTKEVNIDAVDFEKAKLSKYDILHYHFSPFIISVPKEKLAKTVVTIQDLIPLIYPKHYPPGTKGRLRFLKQKYLFKNVDAVITISETSKKDICRFLEINPNKVHVTPLAPRKIFKKLKSEELKSIRAKYNLPAKFVLYVGDINYNKNVPTLVEACKLAKVPLVICGKQALDIEGLGVGDIMTLQGPRDWVRYLFGKPHPELAHYEEVLSKFRKSKDIIRLGFVPDSDLVKIYNLATVYCQPSFYEGFGLPVLEAQASGCPVIASKIQVHVEIAEDSALFFDPKSPQDLAAKITKMLKESDLKEKLIAAGLTNSKKYSWEKTAKATAEVYKSL